MPKHTEVDHIYFERPYYLAPDGAEADQAYRVIREAMVRTGSAAIGRVVLARTDHAVAIQPKDRGMLMMTLRPPIDMRAVEELFADMGAGEIDDEMVELAGIIMDKRAGHFDPSRFHDAYQVALRRLVEAKMRGEAIEARPAPEPPPVTDLGRSYGERSRQSSKNGRQRTGNRQGGGQPIGGGLSGKSSTWASRAAAVIPVEI